MGKLFFTDVRVSLIQTEPKVGQWTIEMVFAMVLVQTWSRLLPILLTLQLFIVGSVLVKMVFVAGDDVTDDENHDDDDDD